MKNLPKISSLISVMTLAAAVAMPASAQTGSSGSDGGQGGGVTASTMTFQQWLNDKSANNARITRRMYMDEAGRRWDRLDRERRGLTRAEIDSLYYSGIGMGGPTANKPNEKKGLQQ